MFTRRGAIGTLLSPASYVVCGALVTCGLAVAADGLVRGPPALARQHLLASVGLYAAATVAAGLAVGLLLAGYVAARRRASPPARRLLSVAGAAMAALLAARASAPSLAVTLDGVSARNVAMGSSLRWGALAAIVAAVLAVGALLHWAVRQVSRGRREIAVVLGSALLALGCGLAAVDLTVLVALYRHAHALLEASAALVTVAGASLLLYTGSHARPRRRGWLSLLALAGAGWLAVFAASEGLRLRVERSLAHVWRQPAYVGRMLLRLELWEDYLRDPAAYEGELQARLSRLVRRYDLGTVALHPRWDLGRRGEAKDPWAALRGDMNIVVFYVDTLRADTAADPRVMPALAAFRREALSFERAYSTASDTVSALPVLTGGCYSQVAVPDGPACPGDLLQLARGSAMKSGLVIAKSAHQFVTREAPRFVFEDVADIADYDETRSDVWGYGADRPTAAHVTDRTLAWIDAQGGNRFLAWSFHFDVHNWQQLDGGYLEEQARAQSIPFTEDHTWRYRAAAAGVDAAFGRLLRGLAERRLLERTVILVVSDHGEALGQEGHWLHAVYLWDSLVRVPMMLRVPSLAPGVVQATVGHVDVASTLARFVQPLADMSRYHGIDLLHHTRPGPVRGALPVLMFSMRKLDLLRIGLVSREAPYRKLVVPLDSVEAELFDTSAPSEVDLAQSEQARALGLLSELVTSPVFPRPATPGPRDRRLAER